jgi:hypothetical protein
MSQGRGVQGHYQPLIRCPCGGGHHPHTLIHAHEICCSLHINQEGYACLALEINRESALRYFCIIVQLGGNGKAY